MTTLAAIKPPYSAKERWQAAFRDWRRGRYLLSDTQTPEQMALDTLRSFRFAPVNASSTSPASACKRRAGR